MKIRHQSLKSQSIVIGSLGTASLDTNGEAEVSEEIHDYVAGKYGFESLEEKKPQKVAAAAQAGSNAGKDEKDANEKDGSPAKDPAAAKASGGRRRG